MLHGPLAFMLAASASLCILPRTAAAQNDAAQPSPQPSSPSSAPSSAPPATTTEPATVEPAAVSESAITAARSWTVRFDPLVWWVSPAGDLRLPSSGATTGNEVELSQLNLDTPEFTPAGAVSINADKVRFSFFGSGYSSDADGIADETFQLGDVAFLAGDPYDASFDLGFYELTAGYRFCSWDWKAKSKHPADAVDVVVDVYGIVGGRFYDLDISVGAPGGDESGTEQFFGDLIAGMRAEFTVVRDLTINLQGSAGGMTDSDRSSFSFDLQVFGEWRPWHNVGVQIGWRHTQFSLEDGEGPGKFEYEGSIAGMFAGLIIRF